LFLQDTYAVLPEAGQAQLRIFNGLNCKVPIDISGVDAREIEPLDFSQALQLSVNGVNSYMINVNSDLTCEEYPAFQGSVEVTEKQVTLNELWYDYGNKTYIIIDLPSDDKNFVHVCMHTHHRRRVCVRTRMWRGGLVLQHQKVMKI
jgi:hypothetical protein